MSDTKFTPSPWRAEKRNVIAASGQILTCCVVGNVMRGNDAEDYATAHLIAAAPELYESLSQIISDLPSNKEWLDPALERMARAALAKARGES